MAPTIFLLPIPGIVIGIIAGLITKRKGWAIFANVVWAIISSCGIIFLFSYLASSVDSAVLFIAPIIAPIITVIILEVIREPPSKENKNISHKKVIENNMGILPKSENDIEYVEKDVILSVEEIPLDNRFGNSKLTSEHELSFTANTSFTVTKSKEIIGAIGFNLLNTLELEARRQVSESVGVQIGGQLTRRVNVTFEVAAGQIVYYRVIWKQKLREGNFKSEINGEIIKLPYQLTYGLFHSVESISSDNKTTVNKN